MNLIFIGASTFGLRCLEACLKVPNIYLKGVITAPQTFKISYRPDGVKNVLYADMESYANENNIPIRILNRSMNEPGLYETVLNWQPDLFLVAGWYHMIPKKWRELAPAYGLHASLLPDYSGGAPLVWAMINGEIKTGITLFQMDDGVDSGPIAGQKEASIYSDDTIATLYNRIEEQGIELLQEVLPKLVDGTVSLIIQDDSKRRAFPQRGPEDGLIDWNLEASFINRFIRAQTRPYPGAFTTIRNNVLHIWKSEVISTTRNNLKAGYVYINKDNICLVGCGKNALALKEVTYEQITYKNEEISNLLEAKLKLGG